VDEARLIQAEQLKVRQTAMLIGKLRTFADLAHESRKVADESRLRQIADELEQGLIEL